MSRRDIAIVGMACRFPDAADAPTLWDNILRRHTSFRTLQRERWDHSRFLSTRRDPNSTYTTKAAHLTDVDLFAAGHFGIAPKRAESMDPQQRLMLEVSREALCDAGLETRPLDRSHTAVFVGTCVAEYTRIMTSGVMVRQLEGGQFGKACESAHDITGRVSPMRPYTLPGSQLSMCASVISQAFDFGGPALSTDAACASSLLAVILGVQYLQSLPPREAHSPAVVAGGVYLNLLPHNLVAFARMGALAKDACRPFDAAAQGFLLGEGAGVVVLKRLDDAIADGDRIYSVIRGTAWNSDGKTDSPLTPVAHRQAALIEAGLKDAGVGASEVGYVECQGSGTAAGDQIELEALRQVFGANRQPLPIGSIKANIGHTLSAGGVAGLMRAALAVYHATLPPQASWERWAPHLEPLTQTLRVPTTAGKWTDTLRRAAVNAFGFGGINAFALLEQAPPQPAAPRSPQGPLLFMCSAPTPALLDEYLAALEPCLARADAETLAASAYTLTATRSLSRHAAAFVASNGAEACRRIGELRAALNDSQPLGSLALLGPPTTPPQHPLLALAAAAMQGQPPRWEDVFELRRLADLPCMPLERQRYWTVKEQPADDVYIKPNGNGNGRSHHVDGIVDLIGTVCPYPTSLIRPELRLGSDLGLDSLSLAQLGARLGGHYGSVPPLDFWRTDPTVAELASLVGAVLPGTAPVPPPPTPLDFIPPQNYRLEQFPEVLAIEERLRQVDRSAPNPYFALHDGSASAQTLIDGRPMLSFSHYNYLGLNGHAEVVAAAQTAANRHGTSACASRLVAGELPLHRELEKELAEFLGCEACVVMVGGHATNVTTISQLVGPNDLVLHDSLIHDSVLQGALASHAARRAFPHNDMGALEDLLLKLRPCFRRVLLVAEGVYSMDGDICDLPRLVALKEKYRCLLMIDEAHSLGVLGAGGRGVAEHFGMDRGRVDVWMGTLSKALASCGGYIAGSNSLVRYLKYTASGFVYSVGMPPSSTAAALTALRVLRREPSRVARLQERSQLFLRLLREAGCDVGKSAGTPVVPVILGNFARCLQLTTALANEGIHVMPILYPAVEESASRLRFFVTSEHSEADLRRAARVVREVLQESQSAVR